MRLAFMRSVLCVLLLPLVAGAARAAEGMWTLDNLPLGALKEHYAFEPDRAFVDHLMHASVRLAGGCSGSFVSPQGLVLTNYHCAVSCVSALSSKERDLVSAGYLAGSQEQELSCPQVEFNRLEAIDDVTARMRKATEGLSGKAYKDAKNAEKARIESECGDDARQRCDVVELYHGGRYQRYRYHRFQDVRLVFAPEMETGFFGGDPDNFQFPRYNLDMALLRAYEDGKPAAVQDWFPLSTQGVAAGELTLVTGHPGGTEREFTVAQLERLRDVDLIRSLLYYAELRGLLLRYAAEDAEHARQAQSDLPFVENAMKAYRGELRALQSPELMRSKREAEAALRAGADEADRSAWDDMAAAQRRYAEFAEPYALIERGRGFNSRYFRLARLLVRGAAERPKPNVERLREFQDARLPQLEQDLFSPEPIYPDYEQLRLAWSLGRLRERLGQDDGFVRLVLGKEAPDALVQKWVAGTRLADVAERRRLWEGGAQAIAASRDPFIVLARAVDAPARALRRQYEDEVEAVESRAAETIARVRFAALGTSVYPDATFTLRLSYGEVKGWQERGRRIDPFTKLAGLFARATGAPPFRLPPRWQQHKAKLALDTPLNFVTTNDIVGGNSGSPVLNRKGELVGLAFDGNIHSLGGSYWFDPALNRCVAVDSRAIVAALRQVYGAGRLVEELAPR